MKLTEDDVCPQW